MVLLYILALFSAASVLNSSLINGIVLPLFMFFAIAVGVIVAMFMRRKKLMELQGKEMP